MKNLLEQLREEAKERKLNLLTSSVFPKLKGKRIQTIYFGYKGQDGVDDFIVGELVYDNRGFYTIYTDNGRDTYIRTDKYSQELFWCSDSDCFVQFKIVE
jgi:hypothetical protein